MAFMVAVQLLTVLVSCSWLSRISLASYSKGCLSTGGVDASVLTTEQRAAIEEQDLIPCKNNSRDRYDFYDAILSNFGEGEEISIYIGSVSKLIIPGYLFC